MMKMLPFKLSSKLFSLRYLNFCYDFFDQVGKLLDKKAKVKFRIHDVTDCTTNKYNTYIAQYLQK